MHSAIFTILSHIFLVIGCKRPLRSIHRPRGVGGVGSVIVGGVGRQTREVADKAPRAAAVGGTHATGGGIGRGAVADTTLDDAIAAITRDIAATDGAIRGDIGGGGSSDRRQAAWGGDDALLAIDGAVGIGGIGAHIVSGGGLQTGEGADEGTQTVAIGAVQVAHRGFGRHAPADTTLSDREAAVARDGAATLRRSAAGQSDLHRCRHRRQAAGSGETLLLTITCAYAVGGIGTHIVGGTWLQSRDGGGEVAQHSAHTHAAVGKRRILHGAVGKAPADDGGTQIVGNSAVEGDARGGDPVGRNGMGMHHRQPGAVDIQHAEVVFLAPEAASRHLGAAADIQRVGTDHNPTATGLLLGGDGEREGAVTLGGRLAQRGIARHQLHGHPTDRLLRGALQHAPDDRTLSVYLLLLQVLDAGGKQHRYQYPKYSFHLSSFQ